MTESLSGGGASPGLRNENTAAFSSTARLDQWLDALVKRGGSDLLLVGGVPACIRFEGAVQPIEQTTLTGPEIEAAVLPALIPNALRQYRDHQISDSSYRIEQLGRFRINLHRERGMAAATVRALPNQVPRLNQLQLPASVDTLSRLPRGLVLIGGPAGSGST